MVKEEDSLSTYTGSNGITTRMYDGLLEVEQNAGVDEHYLGYQSIISFSNLINNEFPNIFVSAPEKLIKSDLENILYESSPVWANSSDKLTCYICNESKAKDKVYAVTCVRFTEISELKLIKDMSENHACTGCISNAELVIKEHIQQEGYKEKFLATTI